MKRENQSSCIKDSVRISFVFLQSNGVDIKDKGQVEGFIRRKMRREKS